MLNGSKNLIKVEALPELPVFAEQPEVGKTSLPAKASTLRHSPSTSASSLNAAGSKVSTNLVKTKIWMEGT